MANSYNGWPANANPKAINVVQDPIYSGGIKSGDVTTVLKYVSNQLNARVEKVIPAHCWGYAYRANVNNPSSLSCHASGTAIDFNAPAHPNGKSNTFNATQVRTIKTILGEVNNAVAWLQGYDEMHFEIAVSAARLAPIAARLRGAKPPVAQPPATKPPAGQTAFPLPSGYYFGLQSGPVNSISGIPASDAKYRPHIKRVQAKVGVGADGYYGNGTLAAVKRWQTANKLTADGLTGPTTWKAMKL